MDKMSMDDLRAIIQEVEKAAKCARCSNLVDEPATCQNSHFTYCSACKLEYKNCPNCRNALTTSNAGTVLKNVLKAIPRKCKNMANGCSQVMLPKEIVLHQRVCSFREVPCRIRGCKWQGTADVLTLHIKSVHASKHVLVEKGSVSWPEFQRDLDRNDVCPVEAYSCIFWLYLNINNEKQKCQLFFVKVPTSDETFYSEVIFSKENSFIKYQFIQKIFNEDVDTEEVFEDGRCSFVPLSEIHHFINKEGALMNNFKIYRESDLNIDADSSDGYESNKRHKSDNGNNSQLIPISRYTFVTQ